MNPEITHREIIYGNATVLYSVRVIPSPILRGFYYPELLFIILLCCFFFLNGFITY